MRGDGGADGGLAVEDRAGVVVIGAGIVGCSAAAHLTGLGWRDVVVLDQGPLFEAGGSTSHAPGLVFQTNPSKTMTQLASYGVKRYSELESDGKPCFYQVGSIEVATTPERWKDLKRKQGIATAWGVVSRLLSPAECAEKSPLLDPGEILGGFYVPSDGLAKGVRVSEAMAREAQSRGAKVYGETEVTGIEVRDGRVRAVETSRGRIETENVLSCAGMWGPRIGRMAGAFVPLLTPMQHQYAWTTPVPGLEAVSDEADHVIVRHQDNAMYFRQHGERYGIGSYKHRSMPVTPDEIPREHAPDGEMPSLMPFTPEDFEGPWGESRRLMPTLRGAEIERGINGLFSFTPDGGSLLGESREVRGFWMAEAVWVTHAAGAARMIAEWMTDGAPSIDPAAVDVHRFDEFQKSPSSVPPARSTALAEALAL